MTGAIDGGSAPSVPAPKPDEATTSQEMVPPVDSPLARLATPIGQAVLGPGSKDGADQKPDRSAGLGSVTAGNDATAPATAKSTPAAAPGVVPTRGGAYFEPAPTHVAPALAPAAGDVGSTPTPVSHLMNQSPVAQSDPLRGTLSVPRPGEPTAPASSSAAQQAAGALDVDGLSGSISRPLSDGNGIYTVTVALHPAELGHLQAVMSLDGNDLAVSLTAQTQIGHDALANATEALKDQLARGGVNVNVTLRDPASQSGGEERYRPPTTSGSGSFIAGGSAAETPIPSGLVAGQIHLVL